MNMQLKTLFDDVCNKIKKPEQIKDNFFTTAELQDFSRQDKKNAGWVSPAYTTSRWIKLDLKVLADNRCVAVFPCTAQTEIYKVLRTRILSSTQVNGSSTIMITSALPLEGKTLTAINLSFAFSKLFEQTVLLVDADLRKQDIHKRLGFDNDRGLVNHLVDNMPLSDIMVWPGIDKISLISGGRLMRESTELLGSSRMKDLVADMKHRYPDRYVIFDAPSVLTGADTLNLAPLVDGIVIVVESGKTNIHDVNKAISLLPGEKILGLVLNQVLNS